MNFLDFDEYKDRTDLSLHLQLLKLYLNIISNSPLVTAAVILGSFAKKNPDRLSDIDLIVFTDKKSIAQCFNNFWEKHPYEIIHQWTKDYSADHKFGKCIYDNFISSEVHVLSHESDFKIYHPMIVLRDSDNFLVQRVIRGDPPLHKDFDALPGGIEGLGWELFDMLKWWQRGRSDLVTTHLRKICKKLN